MNFIEKLERNDFHGFGTCTPEEVTQAEECLALHFPDEYKLFLQKFRAGTIMNFEIMGLSDYKYLDTVYNTKFSQENDQAFPQGCFVIENSGIEGLLTLANEHGQIFSYCDGKTEKIAESFEEFFSQILSQK